MENTRHTPYNEERTQKKKRLEKLKTRRNKESQTNTHRVPSSRYDAIWALSCPLSSQQQ